MDSKEKKIIRKYFFTQNPSSQEQKQFLDLIRDPSNKEAILKYLDELAGETPISKIDFDKNSVKHSIDLHIQSEINKSNRNYSFIFKIAAVFLLFVKFSQLWIEWLWPRDQFPEPKEFFYLSCDCNGP